MARYGGTASQSGTAVLERTERRSTNYQFRMADTPDWVTRSKNDYVIEADTELELQKFELYVNAAYTWDKGNGRLKSASKSGVAKTDELITVTIPAGSKVRYLPADSDVACFVSNVRLPSGRPAQIAFDAHTEYTDGPGGKRIPRVWYSARLTSYGQVAFSV